MLGMRQGGLEPACSGGPQSVLQTFMLSGEMGMLSTQNVMTANEMVP